MSDRRYSDALVAIERDLADENDRRIDAEVRRISAMSLEERERELVAAGYDLDELDAEADALFEKTKGLDPQDAPPAGAPVAASDIVPIDRARNAASARRARRWPWALAACFLLLATAVAAFEADRITALRSPAPSPDAPQLALAATVPRSPKPPVGPDGLPRHNPSDLGVRGQLDLADDLRKDAGQLCETGQWDECRELLDKARRLDPDGEGTDQVKRLRARVESAQPARPQVGASPVAPPPRPKEK